MNASPLRIGLAGFGTVGSGLSRIINDDKSFIAARCGRTIEISTILVRDITRTRPVAFPEGVTVTDNMDDLVNNPDIDVIVEVMGGIEAARILIEKAIQAGKHVVTANKALLAEKGERLFAAAKAKNLHLRYEASVCGGIPIVETLCNGLAANKISSLLGILNGTSNFILSEMSTRGISFSTALEEAQEKGYAEADPTLDIEGIDTAHKLTLLIRLAWGVVYPFSRMSTSGITTVQPVDIRFARTFGYRIKLIAHAKMQDGRIEAAVFPALVHETYLLSRVGGAYNAVRVHGDAVGSVFLHGKGAGDMPTGSAVAADLLTIARGELPNNSGFYRDVFPAVEMPHDAVTSNFYMRFQVKDQPGVMRDIASVMAENNISIAQAIQKKEHNSPDYNGESVPFTLMTHKARLVDVEKAIEVLSKASFINEKPTVYRVLSSHNKQ